MKINLTEGRGRKPKVLSKEQEKWLTEYLERPEMTYTNPGRKDNVYTGKIDGKKHYEQKRYLLWTLRDALGIVNNQEDGFYINFQCDLSFAVFYRLIKNKKQFIFKRDIPDTSCLCEICENAEMMAKGLRKVYSSHAVNAHDIVEKYSCDSDDPQCMMDHCGSYHPTLFIKSLIIDDPHSDKSESGHETNNSGWLSFFCDVDP